MMIKNIRELRAIMRQETPIIERLARSMRLTQQSVLGHHTTKHPKATHIAKPWE